MTNERMYLKRVEDISCWKGCNNKCSYCAFNSNMIKSKCDKCRTFEPHAHINALSRVPKVTPKGMFSTIALNGDISFAPPEIFEKIVEYCKYWHDRTFLLQSKNPKCFLPFDFPENVMLGTTLETNRDTSKISKAPHPMERAEAMLHIPNRRTITIEPIMDFDVDTFFNIIMKINPHIVWLGYDSKPEKNNLPEPEFYKVNLLINWLKINNTDVRLKDMRGNKLY